jgi:hypothetical protein
VRGRCRAAHETRPSARSNPGIRVLRSKLFDCGDAKGAATLTSNWSARFIGLRGAATRRRCSLLVVIALAGFGAAYVPATGSSAAPAKTTLPKPDPYPTTTQHRPQPPPPPPPAHVPPPPAPPPPPPPPAVSAVPPPPPPPPARSVKPRPRVQRTRAHEPDPRNSIATSYKRPVAKRPAPERDRPRSVAAAAPVAASAPRDELRLPAGIVFLLAGGLLFLLVTAAVAVIPARALPARAAVAVEGRREQLLFVGLCALGLGFTLALLVAFVSS